MLLVPYMWASMTFLPNRYTMQVNGFQNANQGIVQMFPSKPLVHIVYGLWSSPDNVFSIRYISQKEYSIYPDPQVYLAH